jgi:hypothetical protein
MACSGRWADPNEYAEFWCIDAPCASEEEAIISNVLDIAASDIHSALAAANACDCGLADWAYTYLKKLNIIDAVIYHFCHCAKPHISDDMRQAYLKWIDQELELIRTGKKELCDGETGADFPAVDYAEMTWTDFNTARIIENEIKRSRL